MKTELVVIESDLHNGSGAACEGLCGGINMN